MASTCSFWSGGSRSICSSESFMIFWTIALCACGALCSGGALVEGRSSSASAPASASDASTWARMASTCSFWSGGSRAICSSESFMTCWTIALCAPAGSPSAGPLPLPCSCSAAPGTSSCNRTVCSFPSRCTMPMTARVAACRAGGAPVSGPRHARARVGAGWAHLLLGQLLLHLPDAGQHHPRGDAEEEQVDDRAAPEHEQEHQRGGVHPGPPLGPRAARLPPPPPPPELRLN